MGHLSRLFSPASHPRYWGILSTPRLFVHNPNLAHYAKAFDLSRDYLLQSKIEKISATMPTKIKEAQSLPFKVGEITRQALRAYQLEAQLAIARQELHQALTCQIPAEKSRKALPSARYITEGDLQIARHGQEEPTIQPNRKRTQKVSGEPSAK
jgi:hypothetical protein